MAIQVLDFLGVRDSAQRDMEDVWMRPGKASMDDTAINATAVAEMDASTTQRLQRFYKPFNAELGPLLGELNFTAGWG